MELTNTRNDAIRESCSLKEIELSEEELKFMERKRISSVAAADFGDAEGVLISCDSGEKLLILDDGTAAIAK